jgi:hypothetical protein
LRSLRRGRTDTITDPWWSTSTAWTTAFAIPSSIAHTLIGRTPFASYEFSRQAAEIVLVFGCVSSFHPFPLPTEIGRC